MIYQLIISICELVLSLKISPKKLLMEVISFCRLFQYAFCNILLTLQLFVNLSHVKKLEEELHKMIADCKK